MTKRTMRVVQAPFRNADTGPAKHVKDSRSRKDGRLPRSRRSDRILNHGLDEVLQSRKSLASRLKLLGLQIRDITGDGNCLFRAVSVLLNGSESGHREMRDLACRTLLSEKELFKPFVMDNTVEEHVAKMSQLKEYGGHLELAALANALHINIVVHHTTSDASQLQKPFKSLSKSQMEVPIKGTIHLVYDSNCLHYDSTVRVHGSTRAPEHFDGQQNSDKTPTPVHDEQKERLVQSSCPDVSIDLIRKLLSEHDGVWEDVVEELISQEQEDQDLDELDIHSTVDRLRRVSTANRSTISPVTSSTEGVSIDTDPSSVAKTQTLEKSVDTAQRMSQDTCIEERTDGLNSVAINTDMASQSTDVSSDRSQGKRKDMDDASLTLFPHGTKDKHSRQTRKHPPKASFRRTTGERGHSPLTIRAVTVTMDEDSDDIDPLAIVTPPSSKSKTMRPSTGAAKNSPMETANQMKVRLWLDEHRPKDLGAMLSNDEGSSIADYSWDPVRSDDSDATEAFSEGTLQRMTSRT